MLLCPKLPKHQLRHYLAIVVGGMGLAVSRMHPCDWPLVEHHYSFAFHLAPAGFLVGLPDVGQRIHLLYRNL